MLARRNFVIGVVLSSGLIGCAKTEHVVATERAEKLVNAAREQGRSFVVYDGGYRKIAYPGGDVPANRGACTDVIVRAYRVLDIDLQQAVHEDMAANFSDYPALWGLSEPDANIDHRRVPNLERFFERNGLSLPVSKRAQDYQPGDLVTMSPKHIALVSDQRVIGRDDQLVIIQNNGFGVREDVQAFTSKPITGHFRYAL